MRPCVAQKDERQDTEAKSDCVPQAHWRAVFSESRMYGSEWGLMVSLGSTYLESAWWYPTFPGFTIALLVFAFNLAGDALRDIFDPKQI